MFHHPTVRRRRASAIAAGLLAAVLTGSADAAPLFKSSSSGNTTSRAYVLSIPAPAATPGDTLFAAISVRREAKYITPPVGWRLVRSDSSSAGTTLTHALYVKVVDSLEPTSYSWRFKYSAGAAGTILAYGGVDTAAPVAASAGRISKDTSTIAMPQLATSYAGTVVVGFAGSTGSGAVTMPVPMTQRRHAATPKMTHSASSTGADHLQQSAGAVTLQPALASTVNKVGIAQLLTLRQAVGSAPAPTGDTTAPSRPGSLSAAPSASSVSLSWVASTDNTAVTGYGVYVNGVSVGSSAVPGYAAAALACGASYTFGVDAYDASGNRSDRATIAVSTNACPTPTPAPTPTPVGASLPVGLPASTGTAFYVSTAGSDANPGTTTSPWRTIQKALNTLSPGQIAYVRAGTFAENLRMTRAGTASAPITISNYPGETPVLDAAGSHPLEVGSTGAYFRFRGFRIQDAPGTSGGNVDIYGHHVEISDNEITNSTDQGIYTDEGARSVHLTGNWIHHNGQGIIHQSHGIYLQGNDHYVANNVIHDQAKGFGIQVYDRNSRSVIVNNTITNNGFSGIVVGGSGGVDNITIRNNILAYNRYYGVSHDSTCPVGPVAIDNNLFWLNGSGTIQSGCALVDTTGGNNASADPRFADPALRTLSLQADSPALSKARVDWASPMAYRSVARPQGAGPDLGAFES